MRSHRRGRSLIRGTLAASLLAFLASACTPIAGGATLLGLVAVGALTSRCYDYLDVTVLDADGRKTCAATVTAASGGSQLELNSCYYTPLTDGRWTLRASAPGFADATSTVIVDHSRDCVRNVQTMQLTLNRSGVPQRPKPLVAPQPSVSPAAPPPPTTPTAMPPPAAPVTPAAPPSAFPAEPPPPVPAAPSNAVPSSGGAVGVFPDR
jgi:hypothetical protein